MMILARAAAEVPSMAPRFSFSRRSAESVRAETFVGLGARRKGVGATAIDSLRRPVSQATLRPTCRERSDYLRTLPRPGYDFGPPAAETKVSKSWPPGASRTWARDEGCSTLWGQLPTSHGERKAPVK